MPERDFIELRSEDVQEILGTPPHWLVRWGTAIVLVGFMTIVFVAWFVRYPDTIGAKVVIGTSEPPVDVIARADGAVAALLVEDKQLVQAGQVLALLQSTAQYEQVLDLDRRVNAWQRTQLDSLRFVTPPANLELGDLQATYSDFVQNQQAFQFGKESRSVSTQTNIGSITLQISQLEQSIAADQKSKKRVQAQLVVAEELYQNQKGLYDQGIISRTKFEEERTKLADLERQTEILDETIIRKQNEVLSLRKGINDVSFSQQENTSATTTRLLTSLNALRSSIDKWKQTYLMTAPIPGFVSLNATSPTAQQYVKQGDVILTIVPPQGKKIVGRLALPVAGSGKVKAKQQVILKLDNYPYPEFGTLEGVVVSKSLVPKDNQYTILISILESGAPGDSLTTSYHKKIPFEQQLQGHAEIITDDKGFLERIVEQIFIGR